MTSPTNPDFLDKVIRCLFSKHQKRAANVGLTPDAIVAEAPDVTITELRMAAKRISIRKAQGLTGIPGLVIKTAALNVLDLFIDTFSACLREGCFPAQ